jgi:hypothetical protein
MAEQQRGARPAARVLFIVPEGGRFRGDNDGGGREDKFVEVAAAWKTEKGGFRFTLDSVPCDLLAGRAVTFIVTPISDERPSSSPSANTPRDNRGRR